MWPCRRRGTEHHGGPAQGPAERVLRRACEGAEEERRADSPEGRQMQHDYCAIARVLHETQ